MVVRFDGLDRYETPELKLCNPSSKYNDGVISGCVGTLNNVTDVEIVYNFNAESELNFRVTYYIDDAVEVGEQQYLRRLYKGVEERRLIFIFGIGYFVISEVKETVEDSMRYKDVTALSAEAELEYKSIPFIDDGTYMFSELLETLVSVAPKWLIGHVDTSLNSKYRTFEDVNEDATLLGFLMEDMQEAYECIFEFDGVNRLINVYERSAYVHLTSIHITNDDFVNELKLSETIDNLFTALTVYGENDLTINAINPLGTNTLYDFSHYISWMSPELGEKVEAWQSYVNSVFSDYYTLNTSYYGDMQSLSMSRLEKERCETVLTMYHRARDNIVAQASIETVNGYNTVIIANGGTAITDFSGDEDYIAETLANIDSLIAQEELILAGLDDDIEDYEDAMTDLSDQIEAIRDEVSFSTYFTQEEYEELCDYMFEGEYTDEYITVVDSMTAPQRLNQMKLLYDRGIEHLAKISVPTQEFDVDVENFVFDKDFMPWTEQIETGCIINVELDDGDVAQLFLSTITINYEDHTLSMKFGNRYNKFDQASLFDEALGNVRRTATAVNMLKDIVYPIQQGALDHMATAIENSRTLTKDAVLSSTNESVVIDDTGFTSRRVLDNGTVDPKQVKITGRNIVFTDDAWSTARTAIGEITIEESGTPTTYYGINAEALIGDIIIGTELNIVGGETIFAPVSSAVSVVAVEYALSDSTTTPPSGEWSEAAPEWVDDMYMWQRTVTYYADGESISYSEPTCIAGATGRTGVATNISTLVGEYYLSSSDTSLVGGEWSESSPVWTEGSYIWSRTKIIWEDGGISYTDPVLDSAFNAMGQSIVTTYSSITASMGTIQTEITRVSDDMDTINEWVTVGDLGNNLVGVKIGKADGTSQFSSIFTADEIGFYDGTDKLAYLSNKKLNVTTVRTQALELTDNLASSSVNKWRVDTVGGFSIKWIGG